MLTVKNTNLQIVQLKKILRIKKKLQIINNKQLASQYVM